MSAALVVIGVALVVRMALADKAIGVVLGVLFIAAGAGRLYLSTRAG